MLTEFEPIKLINETADPSNLRGFFFSLYFFSSLTDTSLHRVTVVINDAVRSLFAYD